MSPQPERPLREAAREIARMLISAGFESYFAGGCVRDGILGADPKDFDIATAATPDQVRNIFPKARGVGEAFGVMLVRAGGWTIEVATFREDLDYIDGRRPSGIQFTDARADALRRDFTINGLFEHPETGEIIDFVGGRADCTAGIVRAIGDPHARIAEDRLRMLRAVRFAARLGFSIDPRTAEAIRAHAGELASVSPERVGDEVRRMLSHPARASAASTMESLGLDGAVFGARQRCGALTRLSALERDASLAEALAAWHLDRLEQGQAGGAEAGRGGEWGAGRVPPRLSSPQQDSVASRLRGTLVLSNDELSLLTAILARREELLGWDEAKPLAARVRLAARHGIDGALAILTAEAPEIGERWRVRIEIECPARRLPQPVLDGDQLIAAGYRPGPAFKSLLEAALDAQIEGRVRTTADALQFVRGLGPA